MRLIIPILLNCILVLVVYLADKYTSAKKLSYLTKYTDGVPEATNVDNKLYGEDKLLSFMNQNASMEAIKLLPALKTNIDEFVGEAPQFDDITMLMLDYNPKKDVSV